MLSGSLALAPNSKLFSRFITASRQLTEALESKPEGAARAALISSLSAACVT